MAWLDPARSYVIRRIRQEDRDRSFLTSYVDFDSFDDPDDSGTLRDYWKKDHQGRPPTFAYLLVDGSHGDILGVLRYRFEGDRSSAERLPPGGGPYVYLSRVGIEQSHQGTRLSRLLLEFFNHVILREAARLDLPRFVLWWKAVERTLTLIRPFTDAGEVEIFDDKWSDHWGHEYYLRMEIEF